MQMCVCLLVYVSTVCQPWYETHVLQECLSRPLSHSHHPYLGHQRQLSFELMWSNFNCLLPESQSWGQRVALESREEWFVFPNMGNWSLFHCFILTVRGFTCKRSAVASVRVAWVCQRAKMFLALFECVHVGKTVRLTWLDFNKYNLI